MTEINAISLFEVFKLIFQISFFIFLFWFTRLYLVKLVKPLPLQKRFLFYIPIVRNLFWIFYSFYVFSFLLSINSTFALVVLIFLVLIFWRLIKDLVFGLIYKIQKGNVIGHNISIDKISGVIVALKNTKIEVRSENDEVFQFSYSLLSLQKISIPNINKSKVLSLNYNLDKIPTNDQLKDFRRNLFSIPYIVAPDRSNIQIIDSNNKILLIVKVFLPSERYIELVQKNIDELSNSL